MRILLNLNKDFKLIPKFLLLLFRVDNLYLHSCFKLLLASKSLALCSNLEFLKKYFFFPYSCSPLSSPLDVDIGVEEIYKEFFLNFCFLFQENHRNY